MLNMHKQIIYVKCPNPNPNPNPNTSFTFHEKQNSSRQTLEVGSEFNSIVRAHLSLLLNAARGIDTGICGTIYFLFIIQIDLH